MLSISHLNVWFGQTEVLRDVSFSIAPLSIVALLGGNGSGKSTVINTICGLVQPRRGSVIVDGIDFTGKSTDWIVRHGVVQVPQGRELFANLTVGENLEMGGYARTKKECRIEMEKILELFPVLRAKRNRPAALLSGGEQQQVAIARALMSSPKILMMDEPTVGLSPILVDHLIEEIKRLRTLGLTILLVEQNVGVAACLADTAYVLRDGEIGFAGPAKELISNEEVLASYLGR